MKLNRKWLMVIALVMSLTMVTAGTLAYLTDQDADKNTMTLGKVEIVQNELEILKIDHRIAAKIKQAADRNQREFVLRPLCDIDPQLILPGQTQTVEQLLAALPAGPAVTLYPL